VDNERCERFAWKDANFVLDDPHMICVTLGNEETHINGAKRIADSHRPEVGFHTRQAFHDSAKRGELLVALEKDDVVGFVRFRHREDRRTTLYEIATAPSHRRSGIGKALIEALVRQCQTAGSPKILLKCPVDLDANNFYKRIGFRRHGSRSILGKDRRLFVWVLPVLLHRKLTFVASLTASTNDLCQMVDLWEQIGPTERPFEKCIITPLFIDPGALKWVKHMHQNWGIRVMFDSGGFFVQQGKIRYEDLFFHLMDFYLRNEWGDTYILPDFVPTSRSTPAEVTERVQVTIAEGIKFYNRLPNHIRTKALGVLQGHQPEHLRDCLIAFLDEGIKHVGFGSFDTSGVNAEINLITERARARLAVVQQLTHKYLRHGRSRFLPYFHLLGVGTPRLLPEFPSLMATSFDSSGWLRTAGFGNIYLPFESRRNVAHGGSALSLGIGLSAKSYYALAEQRGHSCPFCDNFRQLQSNRFYRMWHNAIVFNEMTELINSDSYNAKTQLNQNL
jgi:Acetyltransferases